jgi:hypothetical protein
MKYILLFLLFTRAAGAQNLSDADLTGTWNLSRVLIKGMEIDFEQGKVTVLEGHEGGFSQQMIDKLEKNIQAGEHSFPVKLVFAVRGQADEYVKKRSYRRSYTLYREAGKDFIRFEKDPFEIQLTENEMRLLYTDTKSQGALNTEIIYKK